MTIKSKTLKPTSLSTDIKVIRNQSFASDDVKKKFVEALKELEQSYSELKQNVSRYITKTKRDIE